MAASKRGAAKRQVPPTPSEAARLLVRCIRQVTSSLCHARRRRIGYREFRPTHLVDVDLTEVSRPPINISAHEGVMVWDVAVIGAGPAGASAALAASQANKRVILLERAALPRYKTCGGGLLGVSISALPLGLRPPLRAEIHAFTFTFRGRLKRTRRTVAPALRLVFRADFDAALIRHAIEAGVKVCEQVTVRHLDQDGDHVRLTTTKHGTFYARAVVGADGSASRTAKYVGVQCEQVDLGIELELTLPHEQALAWKDRILIDWGQLPGAYGWVFPKGDTLSVGVIADRRRGQQATLYLQQFLARLGLDGIKPTLSSGHLTRCRTDESPLSRGRVLVAGDAAGLLEPWTREGISYALRSGRMAGSAAVATAEAFCAEDVLAATNSYNTQVTLTLGAEMAAGRLFMQVFSRRPWLFHIAIITLPAAWHIFLKIISGQATLAGIKNHPVLQNILIRLAH
jgi:geranylgeranyl reductase family protein